MMGQQPRRTFSPEFKLERVREVLDGPDSTAAVARRHELNDNLLFKWVSEYRAGALWVKRATQFFPVVLSDETERPKLPAPPERSSTLSAILALNSGHRLELSNLNVGDLKTLIEVLS